MHFTKINGKWKICAGKEEDYLYLNNKELKRVYISGVLVGAIPIALFSLVNWWGLFLLALYMGGCASDLKKAKKLAEE